MSVEPIRNVAKRILTSKAVIAALVGVAIKFAVSKGWIPETGAAEIAATTAEYLAYILAAVFRVTAKDDLKTGEPLKK